MDSFSIEAQKGLVSKYNPMAEYTEIESGTNNDRPQLKEAIAFAKSVGATLVVAKVDRLGRNAAYIFTLIDSSGVDFIFADMPSATKLVIGIMALVAEDEAKRISDRIKAGFVVKRNRGEKMGNPENFNNEGRAKGSETNKKIASEKNKQTYWFAKSLRDSGKTLKEIKLKLIEGGFKTIDNNDWGESQISRLLNKKTTTF
jgi:DNA invertase Pin-like site-specific DNA recombinase